jgi:hypothetical protein
MSKAKFKAGQSVKYGDEPFVIKVSRKNFSNNKILYNLSTTSGAKGPVDVPESELTAAITRKAPATGGKKGGKKGKELELVRKNYLEAVGQEVPSNKKNDLEWMKAKIVEANADKDVDSPYATLAKLDREQLISLIKEKEYGIDPADYESDEELLVAVCEEAGIEVPKSE